MYRTEDGVEVKVGDRAYDYYSMKPGTIEKDAGMFPDPWFDFRHDDGTCVVLNGQRICTMAHAERMGWPGAKEGGEA